MSGRSASGAGTKRGIATTVAEALELTSKGDDVFVASSAGADDPRGLYGGRLTAQAMSAAAHTVPEQRLAHSMHSYFLVPADATKPIRYTVHRERDGGRYSVRRVIASQGKVAILHLEASFQQNQPGYDYQAQEMPKTTSPQVLTPTPQDPRMLDLDVRIPEDDVAYHRWPTRLWIRIKGDLADSPNVRACGLIFVSDMCTGLSKAPMVKHVGILPSIDHNVWIHRPCDPNRWMLLDLAPESTSNGRGMYAGRLYDENRVLLASLVQESLFGFRGPNGHSARQPNATG